MGQLPGWWLVEDCAIQDPGDEGESGSAADCFPVSQSSLPEGYAGLHCVLTTSPHLAHSSGLQLSNLS